jgi:hypothetical protein
MPRFDVQFTLRGSRAEGEDWRKPRSAAPHLSSAVNLLPPETYP